MVCRNKRCLIITLILLIFILNILLAIPEAYVIKDYNIPLGLCSATLIYGDSNIDLNYRNAYLMSLADILIYLMFTIILTFMGLVLCMQCIQCYEEKYYNGNDLDYVSDSAMHFMINDNDEL